VERHGRFGGRLQIGSPPGIRTDTLRRLVSSGGETLRVLTAQLADPRGYGRIVRDRGGDIQSIVEERDASVEQRAIREINPDIPAWLAVLVAKLLAKRPGERFATAAESAPGRTGACRPTPRMRRLQKRR